MKNKKKILLIVVGILITFGIVAGISYAWWNARATQEGVNTIQSTCLEIELHDETSAITLSNAYPITDYEASLLNPYTFKITNKCNTMVEYDVNLEIMKSVDSEGKDNRLSSEYVAIEFNRGEKKLLNSLESSTPTYKKEATETEKAIEAVEGRYLVSGSLNGKESKSYTIKLWMDESVEIEDDAMNKNFISKIVVTANQSHLVLYSEALLNGADPVLKGNLIPVEIDETGKVTKANIETKWYSYEEKKWANAVILNDKSITYQDNQEIPEENIESYFVWIPKYSYELWDLGTYNSLTSINTSKVHTIPIKFGLTNTNDANDGECTTPMTSGASGKCKIGDYMTPPAFITMGTNGLWVGKFETGYKGSTAPGNVNNSSLVQIKPNVYSWRNIQVSNMFYTSYNYQRELDSHMMKNTEWGAVAYLQHSAYGSATSVRINNNSAFITGYAAKNEPTTGYTGTNIAGNVQESTSLGVDGTNTYNYKNTASQVASTTGNYTGIYDMSGGAWEYVMSVRGSITAGTGISGSIETKYYDIYSASSSTTTYQYRILGDGTSEFGPFANATYGSSARQIGSWYSDESWFVYSTNPWFVRGGSYHYGLGAGVFDFGRGTGGVHTNDGFRLVLAV